MKVEALSLLGKLYIFPNSKKKVQQIVAFWEKPSYLCDILSIGGNNKIIRAYCTLQPSTLLEKHFGT